MKKLIGLLAIVFVGTTLMAQATPGEKREVKNDLVRERDKRVDATKAALRGEPAVAREDHREAVAYHKEAVRKAQQVHRRNVRHHRHVRHHRRYRRPHHDVRH